MPRRTNAPVAHTSRDFREYLEVPMRHPLWVIVPFVLTVAGMIGFSFTLPKMYRSSTTILVESEKVPEYFVPKVPTASDSKRLQTIKQEILSRSRLEVVLRELNPYPDRMGREPLSETLESMRHAIDISVRGSDSFSIEYVHPSPHMSMLVPNRLASSFIEGAAHERAEQVQEAYKFIEVQVEEARKALEAKESAVREYKQTHLGYLPEQMPANLATLQRLQLEAQAVANSLQAAKEREATVERGVTEPRATPGPTPDPATDLSQLRRQLVTLRTRYTEEHPEVRMLKSRIASLEKAQAATDGSAPIDPAVTAARARLEDVQREVKALEARQAELRKQMGGFETRVEQTPRMEQELAGLTRDYQKLNENYMALLNKKLDAQMAEKLEQRWKGERFRILDPAYLPDVHYSPRRSLFALGGLVLGLILGVGAAFLVEALDHSVKTASDLKGVLPFPVLASIPHVEEGRGWIRDRAPRSDRERSAPGRGAAAGR
jgi:protein tyrosine kinase modulator